MVRVGKIRTALIINQIVGFVIVPAWKKKSTLLSGLRSVRIVLWTWVENAAAFQDLSHSFSLCRPPSRQITYLYVALTLRVSFHFHYRRTTKHFKRFLNTYNLECGTLYEKNFSCYNIWPQATLKPGCTLVYMAATKSRITKDLRNRWSLVTERHTGRKASDTLLQRYQDLQLPEKRRKKIKTYFHSVRKYR